MPDGITVFFVISYESLLRGSFNKFGVLVRNLNDFERFFDGQIVLQYVKDKAFLYSLFH